MCVVLVYVCVEQDHVDGVKPSAAGIQIQDDIEGCFLCVEGVSIFEVIVPDLIDGFTKELSSALFSRFVAGKVIQAGLVSSLCSNMEDRGSIVQDGAVVERESSWPAEGLATVLVRVLHGICDNGLE